MDLQNGFNLFGLIVNMIGAYIMYRNAPAVNSQTILYQREEIKQKIEIDKHKNKMSRYGMLILFFGFLFQLVAFFL